MNIKLELLKGYIEDFINDKLADFEIEANEIADTAAILVLSKIRNAVCNTSYTDFDVVEEIVCIFESNGIYCGGRHDF